MEMVKDIILDDTGDLSFENGDFKFGDSDQQHVVLIINTFVGNWKNSPTCGVGIINYLCSSGQGAALKRSISVQLEADGYKVNNVLLQAGTDGLYQYSIDAIRP